MKGTITLVAFSLFVILIAGLASAQPKPGDILPVAFTGNVTVNGNPVPDGWLVTAKIDGVDVAGTVTINGLYGRNPDLLIVEGEPGDTIEFLVKGVKGGEATFPSQSGVGIHLDLSITGDFCGDGSCSSWESCSSCESDCGECSDGNGGGGNGGGGGYVPPEVVKEEICLEDWQCTEWFECVNGEQERVCTDQNSCDTEEGRPAESQECEVKVSGAAAQECEMGEKTCDGRDLYVCSKEGEFIFMEECDSGCSNGECNAPGSIGSVFDSIGSVFGDFFASMGLGGEVAESDKMTGFSVQTGTLVTAGVVVAVIAALLVALFLRKNQKQRTMY